LYNFPIHNTLGPHILRAWRHAGGALTHIFRSVLLSACLGLAAHATVINFDSGQSDLSAITPGYGGLNWSNFFARNSLSAPVSGYVAGAVSPLFSAYNGGGTPASFSSGSLFMLGGFYLTPAWNDGLNVSIIGKAGGSTLFSTDVVLIDIFTPLAVSLNWAGIDTVEFRSSGGTLHPDLSGSGTHFALDDLTINETFGQVPEPSTWLLMGAGLAVLPLLRRKR
jgi:hypothetical protein